MQQPKNLQKGLGRGLENLLGEDKDVFDALQNKPSAETSKLALDVLQAGKYQPRSHMDETALIELADSIKEQGLMQPILVRPIANGRYEIIAGERRYRAAKLAGLTEVPVLIKDVSDQNAAIMALIENMQREDLNPLEEARGIKRLIDEFKFSHEKAAQAIGRSRSLTTNLLRLLNLAAPVQTMLNAGDIDMGHARALLSLDNAQQIIVANQVHAKQLSVRETEKLVNKILAGEEAKPATNKKKAVNRDLDRLQENLSDYLATTVSFKMGKKGSGQLIIDFSNSEHINSLLEKMGLSSVFDE
ncbi:chromosome partitioning protein ParB [Pelistega indica]|uniref:Chromosome partitioning protein ParB n=1 Tax=Pelistega indica TaxID=1414851 RepID=V8FTQ6_9BURK|nr:ParB/RepB/Spo0J family partition protein [Pelistega indica]ETD67083.1 chromosome partitioning protein ParB [Pelistega indica]